MCKISEFSSLKFGTIRQGFTKYRKDVMTAIAKEEALAGRRAEQAAARQKALRAERVQNVSKRCRRLAGSIPSIKTEEISAADRKATASSVFRKDHTN